MWKANWYVSTCGFLFDKKPRAMFFCREKPRTVQTLKNLDYLWLEADSVNVIVEILS